MNKKTRKLFTWCLVVALVVTQMLFANVAFAATSLKGTDRYQTALEVVKAGWTKNDNAVIARGDDLADALAAAPLAYAKGKAPILLTETAALPAGVMEELTALGVKNVYIVGGTGAVSQAVETALAAKFTVKRLSGADRAATALAVAKEAFPTQPTKAVMVNGYAVADALSISAIAAYNGMPILLVDKDTKAADVATYLTGKTVYAVGGEGVISAANAGTATRLSGTDRYATNVAVLGAFTLDYSKVFVAVGEDANAVDALGGAAFAALGNNPIVLVNGALTTGATTLLTDKLASDSVVYTLGGVVPASVATAIETIVNGFTFKVKAVSFVDAKTVQISFTRPVDEATVVSGGKLINVTFTNIGSAAAVTSANALASLSDDGKTLTITPEKSEYFNGSYAVTVTDSVKDEDANKVSPYSAVQTLTDSVRPTVSSVTYPVNGTARVTFTEPINVGALDDTSANKSDAFEAKLTIVDADGASVPVATLVTATSADNKSFDLNIGGFVADANYKITLIGLADFAGNLITPNPVEKTVVNGTVDNVKPTVTKVEALDVNKVRITFSEKLSVLGTVNTEAVVVGTNATVDTTGTVYTVTTSTAAPALSGVTVVTIAGFKDLSNNAGTTVTKTLNFLADTTAPTYVSHEVKTIGAQQFLYIKYSEVVTKGAGIAGGLTGTYVDASSITLPMTAIGAAKVANVLDTNGNRTDTISVEITGLAAGTYTVATDATMVDDLAGVSAASKTITFAFGTYADPTVPAVSNVYVQNNKTNTLATEDTVYVLFSMPVTAATALNVANYTVEGQPVFESAIFDGDAKTVKLTLKDNVIALTGARLLTIQNVATAAGKVMVTKTSAVTFVENVKPYLVSAKVASATTITATFSENVTGSANAFEVYVDGTKLTGVTAAAAVAGKTVVITLPSAITDLTKTYTVKFIGTDYVDGVTPVNSAVTGTTVTVQF